jgi:acetoin utilization deacetylase AcuC-like enzyme
VHVLYSDKYVIDLPPAHSFPIQKYRLVREQLTVEGTLALHELLRPDLASEQDIRLVHTAEYWTQVERGTLPPEAIRRIGLPWSESLVRRSRASVQGTLTAACFALEDGVGINLAGGTHHAFPDHGEGYCVLNDIAIAIRVLQRDRALRRVAVIDCDVHQGNGTAAVFSGDANVFTFSIHGANNYPARKVPGTLDIDLPDGTGDEAYLAALEPAVKQIVGEFRPDMVFYQAGADPLRNDRFGRLRLTHAGLRRRDELVLGAARDAGIPVAITMGGGYGHRLEDTVEAHCNTIRAARAVFANSH